MALTISGNLLSKSQADATRSNDKFSDIQTRVFGSRRAAAAAPTAASLADAGLVRSSVADILGLRAQATVDESAARAEEITAKGLGLEADAYLKVSGFSAENAGLAQIAGEIRGLQSARSVRRTIGSQRAAVASAGFGSAGSSLDLLRSSMQEGFLSSQLIKTTTALTRGGYLQEGAAAEAQAAGAMMASESALELAKTRRAAGALSTANAAAQTDALAAYMTSTSGGAPLTPAQMLALGTLSADPTIAGSFTPPAAAATAANAATRAAGFVNPLLTPDGPLGIAGTSNVAMSV